MAVFTELTDEDRDTIASAYGMRGLSSVIGIANGDAETTYLFRTPTEDYIVTLFEHDIRRHDLELAFQLMEFYHRNGIPSPCPIRSRDGQSGIVVGTKLIATVTYVPGSPIASPTTQRCRSVGVLLAQMHRLSEGGENQTMLGLPAGRVHGALWKSNVFFVGVDIGGLINFRHSRTDVFVSDLADVLLHWTMDAEGAAERTLLCAILQGYESVRTLSPDESKALPVFVSTAVVRRGWNTSAERRTWDAEAATALFVDVVEGLAR